MTGRKKTWIVSALVLALGSMLCCTCTGVWAVASRQASPSLQATAEISAHDNDGTKQRQSAAVVDTPAPAPATNVEAAPHVEHPAESHASAADSARSEPNPAPGHSAGSGGPVGDLQALGAYAQSLKPLLEQGLAAAERDGEILKAAEDQPDLLCSGDGSPLQQLENDAALMHDLVRQLGDMSPPPEARATVHEPLTESARLWGTALDNLNESCRKAPLERGVMRLGAAVQLGSSMLSFRIAYDNYWRLALANGLEALVGPAP